MIPWESLTFWHFILATSFGRSQLQPLFPILEAVPDGLHSAVPYLLSSIMGTDLLLSCLIVTYFQHVEKLDNHCYLTDFGVFNWISHSSHLLLWSMIWLSAAIVSIDAWWDINYFSSSCYHDLENLNVLICLSILNSEWILKLVYKSTKKLCLILTSLILWMGGKCSFS